MKAKKIIVLGAGIAGLSAAWHLKQRGISCKVLEKEPEIGGLCRSKNKAGFTFDFDGHLMHFRHKYTLGLIKHLLKDNLVEHKRSAWVYLDGFAIRYPFQANLYGLPSGVVKECLLGFINAQKSARFLDKKSISFSKWITATFGDGIARHFMVPYNSKFWTMPPEELTCEWLDGFIPVPKLKHIIDGAIEDSKRQFGYNSHFWYPKNGGINQLPDAFARPLENVRTNCRVREIDFKNKTVKTSDGLVLSYDHLISTIALPELPEIVKGLPSSVCANIKQLRWNSIFNVNLGVEASRSAKKHWVYFPQKELSFFRVGFAHNFSKTNAPKRKESLYVEVSYSERNPLDKKNIMQRVKNDLKNAGILKSEFDVCVEDVNDIKYGYPIYDFNCSKSREVILDFLKRNSIIGCGRYGSWRYFSMEDSILDGRRASLDANG